MNAEIIKVARKAATHFMRMDGYGQAAEIITMLCDELEKTQHPNDTPRTVASVLLERWAKDTEAMAKRLIGYSSPINYFTADHDGQTVYYKTFKEAVAGEVAYLNSAAPMSEYIERGALSGFIRNVRKDLPKDSKDFFTRDEMLLNFQQYIDAQPAADVEPVVRCGKCKYAEIGSDGFIETCEYWND